jgi:hypothetical protein
MNKVTYKMLFYSHRSRGAVALARSNILFGGQMQSTVSAAVPAAPAPTFVKKQAWCKVTIVDVNAFFVACSGIGAMSVATWPTQVSPPPPPTPLPCALQVTRASPGAQLLKCSACPRRFHLECVGIAAAHQVEWTCRNCVSSPALSAADRKTSAGELATFQPFFCFFF